MDAPPEILLGVEKSAADRCWVTRAYNERIAQKITQQHHVPDIIARLMAQRGVTSEQVVPYLNPKLRDAMPNPSVLADMDKAAKRLADAILNNEKIATFGDYDVDGATSSALVLRYFAALGKTVRVYIPDRMKEGYGPNVEAFRTLQQEGMALIITVDCGTMAHEALAFAQQANMDVIVADHHQTGVEPPPCFALINPRRADDTSGLDYLAAVGVTYMLLIALSRELRARDYFTTHAEPDLFAMLDIVALGTVCDIVPLCDLNRVFVWQGLKIMAARQNTGLRALADIAKLNTAPLAFDCGFRLGPRINAGGRVGDSMLGVRLLSTESADEAAALALRMDELNTERRAIGDKALARAEMLVEEQIAQWNMIPPFILVADADFHIGVVGIVAARLKDKYRRPCFVLGIAEDGTAKGSARSVPSVDIGRLVAEAVRAQIITGGGGHAMAAGVTLADGQVTDFRDWLTEKLGALLFDDPHYLHIDALVSTDAADYALYEQIQQVGPYGTGNPSPRFVIPAAQITYADIVGENHVRCRLASNGGRTIKGIAFASVAENVRTLLYKSKTPMHIAGYLEADTWQGRQDIQFMIHDAAPV